MALAKGARMHGAKIFENVAVDNITKSVDRNMNSRVTGVTTSDGRTIKAKYVVNCAGMWARQFGQKCGVNSMSPSNTRYTANSWLV